MCVCVCEGVCEVVCVCVYVQVCVCFQAISQEDVFSSVGLYLFN